MRGDVMERYSMRLISTAHEAMLAGTVALCFLFTIPCRADVPGGFLEQDSSSTVRPLLTPMQIQSFLPARGPFTFPSPYGTRGIRITNAGDCGGNDCVDYVGYSYWRNMNDHVGSN